jgi:hypothetical protein
MATKPLEVLLGLQIAAGALLFGPAVDGSPPRFIA